MSNELMDAEFTEQPHTVQAVAQGQTALQVRSTYATAMSVPVPRNLSAVERRLFDESQRAGDLFYYGWGEGDKRVEGPSVNLAIAAARCWGNCAVENLPVQETADAWIFTAAFVDLETGFTLSRQFRQSKKWAVHGRFDPERKDDIRFQIGQSKAVRNVVCNALPAWLMSQAIEHAKRGMRAKLERYIADNGIAAAQELVVRGLAKHGVSAVAIAAKFAVAATSALTVDHLVILRGDLTALDEGNERAGALFPGLEQSPPKKAAASPLNDTLPQAAPDVATQAEPAPEPVSEQDRGGPLEGLAAAVAACQTVAEVNALEQQWLPADHGMEVSEVGRIKTACDVRRMALTSGGRKNRERQGSLV